VGEKAGVTSAERVFEDALAWLAATYPMHGFSVERDLVWTLQRHLGQVLRRPGLSWRAFNDYPMLPGPRRALSADLVIVGEAKMVLLAAEFKFEPDHQRHDIPEGKFPVCTWKDIAKDCLRANEFVAQGKTQVAYAILVDEGGYFKERTLSMGQTWSRWRGDGPDNGAWVLSYRAASLGPAVIEA
jgi:hypothetical protein